MTTARTARAVLPQSYWYSVFVMCLVQCYNLKMVCLWQDKIWIVDGNSHCDRQELVGKRKTSKIFNLVMHLHFGAPRCVHS